MNVGVSPVYCRHLCFFPSEELGEFEFFVSDSCIPMEHPKIEAGSSTLPHTSFLPGVRGASSLGWAIMAGHRANLATRDDIMTVIIYRHFHYIEST